MKTSHSNGEKRLCPCGVRWAQDYRGKCEVCLARSEDMIRQRAAYGGKKAQTRRCIYCDRPEGEVRLMYAFFVSSHECSDLDECVDYAQRKLREAA